MEKLKAVAKKAAPWVGVFVGGMVAGAFVYRKFTLPAPSPAQPLA